MTTLDKIQRRLTRAGIDTRRDYIITPNGRKPILMAYHDYTGPYPSKDTWQKISTVEKACKSFPVSIQLRGYYQASYIMEAEP